MKQMKHRILCTDGFAEAGIAEMRRFADLDVVSEKQLAHEGLVRRIAGFEGLIVRSASKVSRDVIEAGEALKIIARAGTGVDNIDLDAATERGIFVVNAPAGNATSTAELAMALILSLARNIPQAAQLMSQGVWEKKKFMGTEVAGKALGIVGLGRIGREVAKRAIAFGMEVIACDPNLSDEQFSSLPARRASIEELCRQADYITVHATLTPETRGMISAREIALMKPQARIINCARGGIVDEEALAEALKKGRIAGAALDVFTEEPFDRPTFRGIEGAILTPHLGASTREAQDAVAIEAGRAVARFFSDGSGAGAVNLPKGARVEGFEAHMGLAGKLGNLLAQLCGGPTGRIALLGGQAVPGALALAAVAGTLSGGDRRVTIVNAQAAAKEMGIAVAEEIVQAIPDMPAAFGVALGKGAARREAWGAVSADGAAKIVMIDGYRVEVEPLGPMILIHNSDQPGVIGRVCSILGDAGVNIAEMQNVRRRRGADALTIIRSDGTVPPEALEAIGGSPGVASVNLAVL